MYNLQYILIANKMKQMKHIKKLLKTAKKHNTKLLLCFEAQNAGGDAQIGMQCIELNS